MRVLHLALGLGLTVQQPVGACSAGDGGSCSHSLNGRAVSAYTDNAFKLSRTLKGMHYHVFTRVGVTFDLHGFAMHLDELADFVGGFGDKCKFHGELSKLRVTCAALDVQCLQCSSVLPTGSIIIRHCCHVNPLGYALLHCDKSAFYFGGSVLRKTRIE